MSVTAILGGLLLASTTSPVILADAGGLQWIGYEQADDLVHLTLFNSGKGVLSGKLVVELVIDGRKTLQFVPFRIWGGQKASVSWVSPQPAGKAIRVGVIVDDGAPI